MEQLITIFTILVYNALLFILCVYITFQIWIKKYGCEIPIENSIPHKNVKKHYGRNALFFCTRSFQILFETFANIIKKFDPHYWIHYCGMDSYVYLYFQRTLIKALILISLITLVVSIPINLFYENERNSSWFVRANLHSNYNNEFSAWMQVTLITIFSIILFGFLTQVKKNLKSEFLREFMEKSSKQNTEWLKMRTVHIVGIPQKDRKGTLITSMLNQFLRKYNGSVLEVVIIPDIHNQFYYEMKKEQLKDIAKLISSNQINVVSKCLLPSSLQNTSSFKMKCEKLEKKIQHETEKPFLGSGHAFVCFDSVHSMEKCIAEYMKVDLFKTIRVGLLGLKERIINLFMSVRTRTTSTFGHYAEMDLEIENIERPEKEMQIYMEHANEPININWFNMGKGSTGSIFLFRRGIINLFIILLLTFLSAPIIALSHVQTLKLIQEFGDNYLNFVPFSNIINEYLPPFLIIWLNSMIKYLIDKSIILENRATYSEYQLVVMTKSVIFFILNMLIIPIITVSTADCLMPLLYKDTYDLSKLANNINSVNTGTFFVIMLLQDCCMSGGISLIRYSEIYSSYFSPYLAHFQRKNINDNAPWRKKSANMFPFGAMYAKALTTLLIILILGTTAPIISLAGVIFFFIHHIVDSFNLLTVHLKEIESSSLLADKMYSYSLFFIILGQIYLAGYLLINQRIIQFISVLLLIVGSIIYIAKSNEKLIDYRKLDEIYLGNRTSLKKYIDKWVSCYIHPLYVRKQIEENVILEKEIELKNDKLNDTNNSIHPLVESLR